MKISKPRPPPRAEKLIFDELAGLCASPGYGEAIAAFCLRDNTIPVGAGGLTGQPIAQQFNRETLCRTEVSRCAESRFTI